MGNGGPQPGAGRRKGDKLCPLNRVTTGLFSYLSSGLLPCRNCPEADNCPEYDMNGTCIHVREMLNSTVQACMTLPGIDPQVDTPLVVAFAREITIQNVIVWRLQKIGPIIEPEEGEPHGARLMADYSASVGRLVKLAKALGITPAQRREIGGGGHDLARLMAGRGKNEE